MAVYSGRGAGAFGARGGIIETNIIGDERLERGLLRLSEYVEDTAAPLRAAKAIAKADMQNRFDTDTDPEGNAWHPLAETTIARKMRSKDLATHPDDILTHTRALEKAATSESAYTVIDDELIFSTEGLPDYWQVHQEGSGEFEEIRPTKFVKGQGQVETGETLKFAKEAGRGKATPARPFIGLSDEAEIQIIEVFDMWYDAGVSIAISGSGTVQERNQGKFGTRLFPAFG